MPTSVWRYIVGCISYLPLLVCAPTVSQAGLKYCNKAQIPIYTAVGYYSGGEWISEGWWTIWPDACVFVTSGPVSQRYYYTFARSISDHWVWGGETAFCVDESKAFTLSQGPCKESRRFTKVDTGDKISDQYVHNFSWNCQGCQVPKFQYDKERNRISAYHVIKKVIYGEVVYIPIIGRFDPQIDEANSVININATIDFDWEHVQRKFGDIAARGINKSDECGDRISVNSVNLRPSGTAAEMSANAHYSRWLCTSMDLPQTTCEDTWIKLRAFPPAH